MAQGWMNAHPQNCIGILVAFRDERPMVDFPDNRAGLIPARTTVDLSELHGSEGLPVEVLLVFNEGQPLQPVIVGRLFPEAVTPDAQSVQAKVDGRRLVLTAQEEIELRCGQARIVLRKNGRISVRGVYVETRAKGVNRIKGGSVQIN